jgi:hypothetical protein
MSQRPKIRVAVPGWNDITRLDRQEREKEY